MATPEQSKAAPSVLVELLCGAFGGTLGCLLVYPLDTIKTRVQAGVYPSASSCIRATHAKEGLAGFYRGFSTPFVSQPLYIGAAFGGLALGKNAYAYARPLERDRSQGEQLVVSGACAGLACSTVVTPFERLKVLLQSATGGRQSPLRTLRHAVAQEGAGTLFRGWGACMLREVPGCMVWFGTFEWTSTYLREQRGFDRPSAVLAGGVAAAGALWTTCMPFERIKTLQQSTLASSGGVAAVAARLLRTAGPAGFFVGLSTVLVRGVLIDVVQFSAADALRQQLE